jgi:hypothetical protein
MSASSNLTPVDENELLARFIYSDTWYRKKDLTVKPKAFLPNPKTNDVSVFRHIGFTETDLLEIGKEGARKSSPNYHGRADIQALIVYEWGLHVEPTAEPPNHANITGWPTDKDKLMEIAADLASHAQFVRNYF